MSDSTERNCNKCIHHTSGMCDSWNCNMQTVEDVKKEAVNEYVKAVVEEFEGRIADMSFCEYRDAFIDAIEIVKQGGVTKNCNDCANYTEHDEVDNGCYLCCKGYEDNYEPKVDNGGVSDDVCEWEKGKSNDDWKPSCEPNSTYNVFGVAWFKHCPYCGKKIKVVE